MHDQIRPPSDIVERLAASLQVNPTHLLRNADIAEAGSTIKHLRLDRDRLRATLEQIKIACLDNAGEIVRPDLAIKFVGNLAAKALADTE